jgi:uncharacterized membrane protein YecN with MAPEG domain
VVKFRLQDEHFLGDNSSKESNGQQSNLLFRANRSHQNFVENVPFAFLLASIVELNGGNRRYLTGALSALFVLRVMHVELGLARPAGMGSGRPIGYFGTMGIIGGLAGYAAFLVKGYWGL